MASITREITVDVAKLNRFAAIVAKQYDRQSRFLKVHIVNEDTEITVESTATVVINARRPDDTAKAFMGTVNDDGTVTVPLTYWMLELDGTVRCDISIINSAAESELTTTLFDLEVQEAACGDDDITEDKDYGVLVDLIEQVSKTNNEAAASAAAAQGYTDNALTYRDEARTAATDAAASKSVAEQSAETAVVKANDSTTAATAAQGFADTAQAAATAAQGYAGAATYSIGYDATGILTLFMNDGK